MGQLKIWINQYFQSKYFAQNQVLSGYSVHKSECSLLNSLDFFAFNVLTCLWTARTIQKFSPREALKVRRVPKELKQVLLSYSPFFPQVTSPAVPSPSIPPALGIFPYTEAKTNSLLNQYHKKKTKFNNIVNGYEYVQILDNLAKLLEKNNFFLLSLKSNNK